MKPISFFLTIALLFALGPRVSAQSLKERFALKGHMGPIIALAFSGDGKTLATASADKTIKLWNATTGEEARMFKDVPAPVISLAFSHDGRTLAIAGANKTVLWDVSTSKVKETLKGIGGLVALSADGTGLAFFRHGNTKDQHWTELRLLNLATKKERAVTKWGEPVNVPDSTEYGTCLAFSADGKTLAVGSAFPLRDDTSALTWVDVASGKERGTRLPKRLGDRACLSFSGDGKTLVAAGTAHVCVLDVAGGKELAALKFIGSTPLAICADSKVLAAATPENTVKIWAIQIGAARVGNIKDYLAKDGKLKEKLTLSVSLGGGGISGAYTGTLWIIETSGAWTQETTSGLAGEKGEKKLAAKGQLTEQQRLGLAHHLAAQDFASLPAEVPSIAPPDTSGGLSVAILFGKKRSGLNTSRGRLADSAPKADDSKLGEWSRFVALTLVLNDLLNEGKAKLKKSK